MASSAFRFHSRKWGDYVQEQITKKLELKDKTLIFRPVGRLVSTFCTSVPKFLQGANIDCKGIVLKNLKLKLR